MPGGQRPGRAVGALTEEEISSRGVPDTGGEELTRAMLNILEDFAAEKRRLEETEHAVVNMLEDLTLEKERLEGMQRAVLNVLEDAAEEKVHMEETQTAILNVLDDSALEKARLEASQRAMLNLLEDFDVERERSRAANEELRTALEELRRAKEAADSANRELEAFSYSVSHDLRAPLRSIDGFSMALLEDYSGILDEEGKDSLQRVRNATQKMGQLIDDLLKLSRVTRGDLNIARIDLTGIARSVAADLQAAQPERRVEFRIAPKLRALGDANLVKVALQNLIGNAWKFTQRQPEALIEVGSREVDGTPAFYVRDNGAGFDMAYADKLFGTFQRLHSGKEYPGTGIGLSIVQRVIHRHGGSVWAEGAPGEGATFWFTLERPVNVRLKGSGLKTEAGKSMPD